MNIVRARGSSGRRSSASIRPSRMKSGESRSALAVWVATPIEPFLGALAFGELPRRLSQSPKLRSITAAIRSSLSLKCQ